MRIIGDGSPRVCPPPDHGQAIVERMHTLLGQFVRQGGARQVEHGRGVAEPAQLSPLHVVGPFYRWGVDTCGPLINTASGICTPWWRLSTTSPSTWIWPLPLSAHFALHGAIALVPHAYLTEAPAPPDTPPHPHRQQQRIR